MVKMASSSASSPISCVELYKQRKRQNVSPPTSNLNCGFSVTLRSFRLEQALQIKGAERGKNATVTMQNVKLKLSHVGMWPFNYDHLRDAALQFILFFFFFGLSLDESYCESCAWLCTNKQKLATKQSLLDVTSITIHTCLYIYTKDGISTSCLLHEWGHCRLLHVTSPFSLL